MDNVHFHQTGMIGTLSGSDDVPARARRRRVPTCGLDEMADTVVHEVSHFFVKQYGELPGTDTGA